MEEGENRGRGEREKRRIEKFPSLEGSRVGFLAMTTFCTPYNDFVASIKV
jgi:hypothetical protein